MKVDTKLEKKLAAYSMAAGVALSGTANLGAAVVHTDLGAGVTLSGGLSTYNIDMHAGATTSGLQEFQIKQQFASTTGDYALIVPRTVTGVTSSASGSMISAAGQVYAIPTSGTFTINGTKNFNNPPNNLATYSLNLNFGGQGDKFIGVRFTFDSDGTGPTPATTHYGWIKVNVGTWAANVKILGFAYETTPNLGIVAGSETSLSVELNSFTAKYSQNAVQLDWTTQSEIDNMGFMLERCVAGEIGWQKIASHNTTEALRGHGTTSEANDYSYADASVDAGVTYQYRLSDIDINGNIQVKRTISITTEATPDNFTLRQNYPNPFNPTTTIEFALKETNPVNLSIYNMQGQLVKELVNAELSAGNHSYEWSAANVPAGTYFYQLQSGAQKVVKKAVLMK